CALRATPYYQSCDYLIPSARVFMKDQALVPLREGTYRGTASVWVDDLATTHDAFAFPSGRQCAGGGIVEVRYEGEHIATTDREDFLPCELGKISCPDGTTCAQLFGETRCG